MTTIKIFRSFSAMLLSMLFSLQAFAQDKGLDVDVDINKDKGIGSYWMWIVGAAVFILLLVAILRSGKK